MRRVRGTSSKQFHATLEVKRTAKILVHTQKQIHLHFQIHSEMHIQIQMCVWFGVA